MDIDAVEVPAEMVQAYRDANAEIRRLEGVASAVKELIKRTMGQHEYATIDGEPVLRWTYVKSRRLDMEALRAAVDPAVLAGCYVQEENRRFLTLGKAK